MQFIDKNTGVAKLRPKQGKKAKPSTKKIDLDKIQVCLNCKKTNCSGNCKKIKGVCI